MWLEIVILGLCAIATTDDLDCKLNRPPTSLQTDPFDVVLMNPGGIHKHFPKLWIRVDFIDQTVNTCYDETVYRKVGVAVPAPAPAADCTTNEAKKWAMWDLDNMELSILQDFEEKGKLRLGERKRGGRCWSGTAPGNMNKACKNTKNACAADVSWIPQYAKASGTGKIDAAVLSNPQDQPFVGAIVHGVAGELRAHGNSDDWGNAWSWEWNYPECSARVPEYKQKFTSQGIIGDIKSDSTEIYLIDLDTGAETSIPLTGTTKPNPAKMEIWNLPAPGSDMLVQRGDRCYIPHIDQYSALLDGAPICRRRPYFQIAAGSECKDVIGAGDPFCPPVLVEKIGP